MWVYSNTEGYKENTYTMYTTLTNPVEPVHYEMMGYDTLLGSHYDKYEVDYADFSDEMPPSDVFYITQGLAIFLNNLYHDHSFISFSLGYKCHLEYNSLSFKTFL